MPLRVTEVPTAFPGYPAGWPSLHLPRQQGGKHLSDRSGRPAGWPPVRASGPRTVNGPGPYLANGSTINEKLRSDGSVTAKAVARNDSDREILDGLLDIGVVPAPTENGSGGHPKYN